MGNMHEVYLHIQYVVCIYKYFFTHTQIHMEVVIYETFILFL